MTTTANNSHDDQYHQRCKVFRQEFATRSTVRDIFLSQDLDPTLVNLFLIFWSAGNAGLTEPIEGYLRRAATNAHEKGYAALGDYFAHHADEEVAHNLWAIDDVHALVSRWNVEQPEMPLDADVLIKHRFLPSVRRYHRLHEKYVDGDAPWGELAIDLEIELMAVEYGPSFIQNCTRTLGSDALKYLSFLRLHVEADEGHSEENFEFMRAFQVEHPEQFDSLLQAAKEGLLAYGEYLDDVMAFARFKYDELQLLKR